MVFESADDGEYKSFEMSIGISIRFPFTHQLKTDSKNSYPIIAYQIAESKSIAVEKMTLSLNRNRYFRENCLDGKKGGKEKEV